MESTIAFISAVLPSWAQCCCKIWGGQLDVKPI